MKRIWFKPDCVRWIREGKKTTTFRKTRHEGTYKVVKGPRFKAVPIGLNIKLTPIDEMAFSVVVNSYFITEGNFKSSNEFVDWLDYVGILYHHEQLGWLHQIEVLGTR